MKLGPKVLGEEEFQRQQKAHEEAAKRAFVYGPRVVGAEPAPEPEKDEITPSQTPENTNDRQSAKSLSLAKLNDALQGEVSDELLDGWMAAEFDREGEPRKGALRLLLRAEKIRGEAARPAIVGELQNALKE